MMMIWLNYKNSQMILVKKVKLDCAFIKSLFIFQETNKSKLKSVHFLESDDIEFFFHFVIIFCFYIIFFFLKKIVFKIFCCFWLNLKINKKKRRKLTKAKIKLEI